MQPFPHRYQVSSSGRAEGDVILNCSGLEPLRTQPPPEFGGPGDRWSPESLLVGAVADCYLLSFRAVASAARLPWRALDCSVEGLLDREQGRTRFTRFHLRVRLLVPQGTDPEMAERALRRAEEVCLVSNSLSGSRTLETVVEAAPDSACAETTAG